MWRTGKNEPSTDSTTKDLRSSERDKEVCTGVSSFTFLQNGTILEGVARDVSDGGARISGTVEGLARGDTVELELVIREDKIRYLARVKHVDQAQKQYGLEYLAGPSVVEPERPVKRTCLKCQRDFEPPWRFCGMCGSDLVRSRTR